MVIAFKIMSVYIKHICFTLKTTLHSKIESINERFIYCIGINMFKSLEFTSLHDPYIHTTHAHTQIQVMT